MKKQFENIAKDYVEAFLRKHQMYDEETGEYYSYEWVSNEIGSVLCVSDYYIPFDDIRYDIDNAVPKDIYFQYYDYVLENDSKINYRSYLKGMREKITLVPTDYVIILNDGTFKKFSNGQIVIYDENDVSFEIDRQTKNGTAKRTTELDTKQTTELIENIKYFQ